MEELLSANRLSQSYVCLGQSWKKIFHTFISVPLNYCYAVYDRFGQVRFFHCLHLEQNSCWIVNRK